MRDGVPYAIDFMNPAPDADIWSVTEPYFNWAVDAVADMLVDYAKNGAPTLRYHRWNRFLNPDPHGNTGSGRCTGEGIVSGVEQVAHTASAVLSEVIEQITEPVKARRARKPQLIQPDLPARKRQRNNRSTD